jgi:DNA-binding NarL/FixJ family response regulator
MSTRPDPTEQELPAAGEPSLGVVLIDAPAMTRAGTTLMLERDGGMEVLVEAGDAQEGLEAVRRLRRRQDVVALIGLSLQGDHDSSWLIRSLREQHPSMPILGIGWQVEDDVITRALFAGADGFVDTDSPPGRFIDAIRRAAKGEVVLAGVSDGWLASVVADGGIEVEIDPEAPVLTERELEVLTVASEGLTARQIGRRLGMRERTVTTHLSRIYRKLGAGSRVSAIARATRMGLVTVGHHK